MEGSSQDPPKDQNLNRLCNLMARIIIRHEDSIQSIHSQDSFMLFFNKGPQGIVPHLLQAAQNWRVKCSPEASSSLSDADSHGADDEQI